MKSIYLEILEALQFLSTPEKRDFLPYFFKTGKGEYAEGDQFIGVVVPDSRKIVKEFWQKAELSDVQEILKSEFHEMRLVALLILVHQFEKSKDKTQQKKLVEFYLKNTQYINNWDLVDCSCYKILGRYCFENQDDAILNLLSEEDNLWSKRIAVVATKYHVKKGSFTLLKELALKNLHHEHDLMHKANGWLLREMGKKEPKELLDFLNRYYKEMPRTTLRYAIEKLDENLRQDYLIGKI
jgi:3-methyladenine DNA glycosylase AlkD